MDNKRKKVEEFNPDELFRQTMDSVLIPFVGKLATVARDFTKAEILEQNIWRTGHFYESVTAFMDAATLDFGVRTDNCPYAGYIEFGTSRMAARYPFTIAADKFVTALQGQLDLREIK
ncbi:hypothetical protein CCP3SC1AL1_320014 [Gammaproteobacteria bacterium]